MLITLPLDGLEHISQISLVWFNGPWRRANVITWRLTLRNVKSLGIRWIIVVDDDQNLGQSKALVTIDKIAFRNCDHDSTCFSLNFSEDRCCHSWPRSVGGEHVLKWTTHTSIWQTTQADIIRYIWTTNAVVTLKDPWLSNEKFKLQFPIDIDNGEYMTVSFCARMGFVLLLFVWEICICFMRPLMEQINAWQKTNRCFSTQLAFFFLSRH